MPGKPPDRQSYEYPGLVRNEQPDLPGEAGPPQPDPPVEAYLRPDLPAETRQRRLDRALAIVSGDVGPGEELRADAAGYVAGRITAEELMARTRARYGAG